MSYRIAISFFAAAAVGMSCIATDASAGSGGGGGRSGGTAPGVRSSITGPTGGFGKFAAPGVSSIPRITGVGDRTGRGAAGALGGGAAGAPRVMPNIIGVGGPTGGPGGGAAAGARYYAPASYDSNAVCGPYPYPPCNAACGRYPYPPCNKLRTR